MANECAFSPDTRRNPKNYLILTSSETHCVKLKEANKAFFLPKKFFTSHRRKIIQIVSWEFTMWTSNPPRQCSLMENLPWHSFFGIIRENLLVMWIVPHKTWECTLIIDIGILLLKKWKFITIKYSEQLCWLIAYLLITYIKIFTYSD